MVLLYTASIFSTFAEGMLYGFSLLLFMITIWFLLGTSRKRRRINYVMLGASCALMALNTAEMGVNIARIYLGLVTLGPRLPGGPEQYFSDRAGVTFVVKTALWGAQTVIFDAVVIYRAYIVWQSFAVVVVPILQWFALVAVSIATNIVQIELNDGDLFSVQTEPWITSIYVLDLFTNFTATTLLAFRIWSVIRKTSPNRATTGLYPVLRVVIESGALYSATIFVGLVLFIVRSNGVYVMNDLTSPIISIVFNMIFVRLGLSQERSALNGPDCPPPTHSTANFVVVYREHQTPGFIDSHVIPSRRTSSLRPDSVLGDIEHGHDPLKMIEMYLGEDGLQTPRTPQEAHIARSDDDAGSCIKVCQGGIAQ